MTDFIELEDSEGMKFITPKSSLGTAFVDEETGLLAVQVDGSAYLLRTTYSEYMAKLGIDKV